ncbi:MAG: hypothetical protein R2844_14045 [Caldilineales bacterium]
MPTVAQTKQGSGRPRGRPRSAASAAGFMAYASSTSISRRLSLPSPAIIIAFSTDECAWLDV